ncbi:MAG TPA: hypothetical protein EYN67_19180, partial [Flavobacteriales bacterium]|nr:hypothetical protein [Flavobacteriales bacterium]
MAYYRFNRNDVYNNTLKSYPSVRFVIYSGSAFYNNRPNIAGAFANPIRLTDAGKISLYELNIDRVSASTGRYIGPRSVSPDQEIVNNGLIYSYVVKNGSRIGFRTSTVSSFDNSSYGDIITSSYPYVSGISKEFYGTTTPRSSTSYVSHLLALKNTINHYRYVSPHFQYSSSARDLAIAETGLVNIPTIFYGSKIKKGTINLKYYITGTLVGRAQDSNRDGVLYSTYGHDSGSAIGLALYSEGFLLLTGSTELDTVATDTYLPAADNPKWIYFAQSISGSITAASSSYTIEMSGTSYNSTMTLFATAPKGHLNQSNNPTFVEYTTGNFAATGSKAYLENSRRSIKNTVSSSYADPTGSFEKVTYISKIGIYDEDRNLIGLAKLATPVKKTVERDFT